MLHYAFIVLLLLACVLFSAAPLTAANASTIELKIGAAIRSDIIRIEDVADVRGANPAMVRVLNQIELGPAPELGLVSEISREQIHSSIKRSLPAAAVTFAGANFVQIRRQGRRLNPEDIADPVRKHVLKTTSWKESEIQIGSIGNLDSVEVPDEENIQLRIAPGATTVGRNRILLPVEAVRGQKTFCSFWITADINIHARILTASRKIPFNKALSADDIVEADVDIKDLRNSYARQPDDLIGKVSRRSFAPGDPLTPEAFSNPILVRHGDTIQLRLDRKGIVLTTPAKAEQDGKLGQTITVRNLEFSTALKAQVIAPGVVKVE